MKVTIKQAMHNMAKRTAKRFEDQTKLGIAKNTVTGLPKASKKFGKNVVRVAKKAGNKALDFPVRALKIEQNLRNISIRKAKDKATNF